MAVLEHLASIGARRDRMEVLVKEILNSSVNAGRKHHSVHAAVLLKWHRELDLLDEDARPKPLALNGPWPSVMSLIRRVSEKEDACKTVAAMKELGLIQRTRAGKFLPVSDRATIASLHPVLIEHVANSLNRLLRTVKYNVSKSKAEDSLIERYTHLPRLKVSDVAAFKKFSQQQGSAFLASVEDWLQARNAAPGTRKKGVSAGVHLIAFVDRPEARRTNRATASRSRAKRA
jgi:hypothetical protein